MSASAPNGSAPGGDELPLSPSETFAHNSAMRVSGGARDGSAMKTQRALASIVLGFELIVVFLIGMTVFGLGILEPRELGIWGGLGLTYRSPFGPLRLDWGFKLDRREGESRQQLHVGVGYAF